MREVLWLFGRFIRFVAFASVAYPVLFLVLVNVLPGDHLRNLRYPLAGYGHLLTRMREANEHAPVDVVFIGSSHAYRGFDPRIWAARGFTSFNLGSSSQTPIQSDLMVREHLPALRPRLVVYEVHPGPFKSDGLESALDFIANRGVDLATIRMAASVPDAAVLNAVILRAWRQLNDGEVSVQEPRIRNHDTYIDGGFVERRTTRFGRNDAEISRETRLRGKQVRAFMRSVRFLKQHGFRVVLVEAPVTSTLYEHMRESHEEFEVIMRSQADFIDMNGRVELVDSLHFYSPGHLNQLGVERFNRALIDTLDRKGWLPASRHDSGSER